MHVLPWLHEVAGLEPVGVAPIVQPTLSGPRRVSAKPKTCQEPYSRYAGGYVGGCHPSTTEVRLLAMHPIAFLRCDELMKLKCSDITINEEGMVVIHQASSKKDQYREGSSSLVVADSD